MFKNLFYPGRPNYEGPVQGLFSLLHHSVIAEWSHNVMERVDYVKRCKSKNEVEIRLWNMCYLSEERLPKEFVEAVKTRVEARKIYEEAWETCMEAAYEEAEKTWLEARDIFEEAEKTWLEAYKTYDTLIQSFYPQFLPLIKELVPDTAWNGKELVFT